MHRPQENKISGTISWESQKEPEELGVAHMVSVFADEMDILMILIDVHIPKCHFCYITKRVFHTKRSGGSKSDRPRIAQDLEGVESSAQQNTPSAERKNQLMLNAGTCTTITTI